MNNQTPGEKELTTEDEFKMTMEKPLPGKTFGLNYHENRFISMSAEKKLELSLQLYYSARELKRSWLKQQHPDWSEAVTEAKVREIFLYART